MTRADGEQGTPANPAPVVHIANAGRKMSVIMRTSPLRLRATPLLVLFLLTSAGATAVTELAQSPETATHAPTATRPGVEGEVRWVSDLVAPTVVEAGWKRVILRNALESKPEGRDLWFIAILSTDRSECWARAYYTPETSTPRLRKGQYADLVARNSEPTAVNMHRYVQLSPADEPFGGLDGELKAPAPGHFPFLEPRYRRSLWEKGEDRKDERPVVMSDDDVIRLVDFYRTVVGPNGGGTPISAIRVVGKDQVCIDAGISGFGGLILHLRRKGQTFEVLDGGNWSGIP